MSAKKIIEPLFRKRPHPETLSLCTQMKLRPHANTKAERVTMARISDFMLKMPELSKHMSPKQLPIEGIYSVSVCVCGGV